MARPPGSHLCLLVLLSQILPSAVATERGQSRDRLHQGTEGWIPWKNLKADGTWEHGHIRDEEGSQDISTFTNNPATPTATSTSSYRTPVTSSETTMTTSLSGSPTPASTFRTPTATSTSGSLTTGTSSGIPMATSTSGSLTPETSSGTHTATSTSDSRTPTTTSGTPTATSTSGSPIPATSSETSTDTGTSRSTASGSSSPTTIETTTSLASSITETQVTTTAAPIFIQNPCQNKGKWKGTHCRCPYGFEGPWCEKKVQENPFCENGGNWIDGQCDCSDPYTGPRCEDVVADIPLQPPPKIVEAQVEVTLKVQQNFSEELKDNNSNQFHKFNESFTKKMDVIYNGIPEYRGVRILRLSEGSVKVDHEVLLQTSFTQEFKEVLKNMTKTVKETITNASAIDNCTGDMCLIKDSLIVSQNLKYSYDPENECKAKVGEMLAKFFYMEYKNNKPNCISFCTPGFSRSVNCNRGKCMLEHSGPKCYCTATDTHWYSGAACEKSTSKTLVYGLVSTAVVFVLAVVITLLSLMLHSKREARRHKARAAQMEKWRAADYPSDPGSYQNMGFESSEGPQWDIPMNPMNRFQPTASLMHPGNQIMIRRPQIKM